MNKQWYKELKDKLQKPIIINIGKDENEEDGKKKLVVTPLLLLTITVTVAVTISIAAAVTVNFNTTINPKPDPTLPAISEPVVTEEVTPSPSIEPTVVPSVEPPETPSMEEPSPVVSVEPTADPTVEVIPTLEPTPVPTPEYLDIGYAVGAMEPAVRDIDQDYVARIRDAVADERYEIGYFDDEAVVRFYLSDNNRFQITAVFTWTDNTYWAFTSVETVGSESGPQAK